MRTIRTIAVGLGLSAYLMYTKYTVFAQLFILDSALHRFWTSLYYLSESTAATVPLGAVSTAVYVTGCLAIGLFISGLIYPAIESFIVRLVGLADSVLSQLPKPVSSRQKIYS